MGIICRALKITHAWASTSDGLIQLAWNSSWAWRFYKFPSGFNIPMSLETTVERFSFPCCIIVLAKRQSQVFSLTILLNTGQTLDIDERCVLTVIDLIGLCWAHLLFRDLERLNSPCTHCPWSYFPKDQLYLYFLPTDLFVQWHE